MAEANQMKSEHSDLPETGVPDDKSHGKAVFIVAAISSFAATFMGSAVNVASPRIGEDFSLSAVAMGWIVTAYLLSAAVSLLPAGRIADIIGKKEVFVLGMGIFAFSSLVSALSTSYAVLLASRVVAGVGSAMGFATGTAILVSTVALKDRGRILGWNVASVYLGLSLGPPLGGIITHVLGWQWIFIASAVAGLLTVALAMWALKKDSVPARGESFDVTGSFLCGLALICILFGLTRLTMPLGIALLVGGGVCAILFARWEYRSKSPLIDIRAFSRNPAFVFSNLAALINYSATAAVVFLLSLYLQYQKGFTVQDAGLILVVQPIVMVLVSPLSGRLSDRIEPGTLASVGMALTVAVLVGFSFLHADTNLWLIVGGLALLGFSFGLFSSPNMNAVMSSVERRHYGVASSTLAAMRVVGQTLSMGIATLIMTLFLGAARIQITNLPDFMASMRVAFAVFAALCVIGVIASLARGRQLSS